MERWAQRETGFYQAGPGIPVAAIALALLVAGIFLGGGVTLARRRSVD
jgi:hypothetical protein